MRPDTTWPDSAATTDSGAATDSAAPAVAAPSRTTRAPRNGTLAAMGAQTFAGVLVAAQNGASWAFTAIWEEYAAAVTAFARSKGSREPDDLASEVFIALFEQLPNFVGGESDLRAFTFSIAYRRVVDELRRRGRRGESIEWSAESHDGVSPSAEDAAFESLGDESVVTLLDGLPEDQRAVMNLRILGDLTIEAIAEILGKREGAVKALQRRALENLRKKVSPTRTPGR